MVTPSLLCIFLFFFQNVRNLLRREVLSGLCGSCSAEKCLCSDVFRHEVDVVFIVLES